MARFSVFTNVIFFPLIDKGLTEKWYLPDEGDHSVLHLPLVLLVTLQPFFQDHLFILDPFGDQRNVEQQDEE